MNRSNRLQERVTANYADLSEKLRAAADYVLANEMDVAVRSLRAISASSGVSPATLSRLARVLGFVSYEELRELCRETVGERSQSLIQRAQKLQDGSEVAPIYDRQATACIANITTLVQTMDNDRLQKAVNALSDAETVVLF
ncbi:MAG: MurR/RpiR family transcriptional regulator, partial [Pseudomonadota bacterium]|nr:MurR/RpiR family transcriptional regulator [Pseudomonadota bacterium]